MTFTSVSVLVERELSPAPFWVIQQFGRMMTSIQQHISKFWEIEKAAQANSKEHNLVLIFQLLHP